MLAPETKKLQIYCHRRATHLTDLQIRSSEFVTIIFIQKTYPCQRLRQYDHTLDSCGFSSPESTQKNEYNTLHLASGRKKQQLNSNLC